MDFQRYVNIGAWAGRSLKQTASQIAAYTATAGVRITGTPQGSGSQPGDPVRGVQAMIAVTESKVPLRHLVLGAFGVDAVTRSLQRTLADIDTWRATSRASHFPTA